MERWFIFAMAFKAQSVLCDCSRVFYTQRGWVADVGFEVRFGNGTLFLCRKRQATIPSLHSKIFQGVCEGGDLWIRAVCHRFVCSESRSSLAIPNF